MAPELAAEIEAMITQRILAYHQNLIDGGQIKGLDLKGPQVSRPPSYCSQLEHRQTDGPSEGLAPLQGAPTQPMPYEREHVSTHAATIMPFELHDKVLGENVKLSTSPRYSILSIGSRDLFFIRETGKLDGTGFNIITSGRCDGRIDNQSQARNLLAF